MAKTKSFYWVGEDGAIRSLIEKIVHSIFSFISPK